MVRFLAPSAVSVTRCVQMAVNHGDRADPSRALHASAERARAEPVSKEALLLAAAAGGADLISSVDLGAQHAPIAQDLVAAFERVLASQRFILGPEVSAFEVEIAEDLDAYWLERESIRWLRRFVMGRKVGIGWGGRAEIDERPERERAGRGGLRE